MADLELYQRVCHFKLIPPEGEMRVLSYNEFYDKTQQDKIPYMNMEFEAAFDSGKPMITKAKIFNPSSDTVDCISTGTNKPKTRCAIDAGYKGNYGTCVMGEVTKFEHRPGQDAVLTLVIADCSSQWNNYQVSMSMAGKITAEEAIKNMLRQAGLTAGVINLARNRTYERFYMEGVSLSSALREMASDTDSRFIIQHGKVHFLAPTRGQGDYIEINSTTGLIEAGVTEYGYKVRTLFMHTIGAGSRLLLRTREDESYLSEKEYKGAGSRMVVRKGKHRFSVSGPAFTEMEVVAEK